MGTKLTKHEWLAYKGAFKWLKVRYDTQAEIYLEITEKWLLENTDGWFYISYASSNEYLFVFEKEVDIVFFKLWVVDRPFEKESG